ncbi:MAG: multidrug effflux MFS transporter [Candidatus Paracaedimonas acanthamoebae]|uniref:Multidrug effflux MFS transporter n=1 Tax=Candidatus Paracaedimonas acanthamoebae TaxID=244581 RepID=A0A8J7PS18_9PROT|nr:multidrug effflux MFS transporter [Candidatus Paracaedimonas acanthamoebae]
MQKFMLPVLFILSLIPCSIEIDISAPSFPEIASYFGVSEGKVERIIAYNFLGFWISAVLYGPLSECYGRRKIMIGGNAILLMGALGCGNVSTIDQLFIWRFIQGLGASASAVVVFAMIADVYKGDKAIRLVSAMNAILTLSMAIAPIMGSFINQAWGWRGNYFIVAGICLISWILLLTMLPETKKNLQKFKWAKIQQDYRKLLKNPQFMCASFVPSMLYASYMAFVTCGAFLYMDVFNFSTFTYACHQGGIITVFSLVSVCSSHIGRIIEKKNCAMLGMVISLGSAVILALISFFRPTSPFLVTLFMSTFCIGFALCYPIIFSRSLELFPHIKGTASSLTMALRALICALIVSLTSVFCNNNPRAVFLIILCVTLLAFVMTRYYFFNKIFYDVDKTKP